MGRGSGRPPGQGGCKAGDIPAIRPQRCWWDCEPMLTRAVGPPTSLLGNENHTRVWRSGWCPNPANPRLPGISECDLQDQGGPRPRDRVLKRHQRGETRTQRRIHVDMEAEMGGRRPPAQRLTPGALRSRKRRGGPSPGDSAGSSALGHPDLRRVVPGTRGGWTPFWGVKPLIYTTVTAALGDPYSLQF